MADYSVEAKIGADVDKFKKSIKKAAGISADFKEKTDKIKNTNVDADTSDFRRSMRRAKDKAESFPRRIVTRIKIKADKAKDSLDEVAQLSRNIQEITSSAGRTGLILISPAAIPILASAVGLAGGLASSLTAAAGAAGLFGVATIGHLNNIAEKFSAIKDLQEKINDERAEAKPDVKKINHLIERRKKLIEELSKPQKKLFDTLGKLKNAWSEFLKKTEKSTLKVFRKALHITIDLLDKIPGAVNKVMKAVAGMLDGVNKFVNSEEFSGWIKWFSTRGVDSMKTWGKIAGNVIQGFMDLMKRFSPLAEDIEDTILNWSKNFRKWASTLDKNKQFQKFVDYVRENGPKIVDILGNLFDTIGNIAKELAPLASDMLDILKNFSKWAANAAENHPTFAKLAGVLLAIGTALGGLTGTGAGTILAAAGAFKVLKGSVKKLLGPLKKLKKKTGGYAESSRMARKKTDSMRKSIRKSKSPVNKLGKTFKSNGKKIFKWFGKGGLVVGALSIFGLTVKKLAEDTGKNVHNLVQAWKEYKNKQKEQLKQTTKQLLKSRGDWKEALRKSGKDVSNYTVHVTSEFRDIANSAGELLKEVPKSVRKNFNNAEQIIKNSDWSNETSVLMNTSVQGILSQADDARRTVRQIMEGSKDEITKEDFRAESSKLMQTSVEGILSKSNNIRNVTERLMNIAEHEVQSKNLRNEGQRVMNTAVGGIISKHGDVRGASDEAGDIIEGEINNVGLYGSGQSIVASLVNGLASRRWSIIDTVSSLAQTVRNFWPFSPAKEGPLRDLDKINFSIIADRITAAKKPIKEATHNLAAATMKAYNPKFSAGNDIAQSLKGVQSKASLQINDAVQVEANVTKQPAQINVRIGNQEFGKFVDDIMAAEDRKMFRNRRTP